LGSDTPWKVVWNDKVYDDLAALDKTTARKIIERVDTHLVQNPVNIGNSYPDVLPESSDIDMGIIVFCMLRISKLEP
jgi:hypothetical protein